MWLLQIADIHINDQNPSALSSDRCLELMHKKILEKVPSGTSIKVALCGDIVFQGRKYGYSMANDFLNKMVDTLPYDIDFAICPGNHDIVPGDPNPFNEFNRFLFNFKKSTQASFGARSSVAVMDEVEFELILLNTAYHGDHKYGLVDIDKYVEALSNSGINKVVVMHHNFMQLTNDDRSTIGNAYEFLNISLQNNVRTILHGHGHIQNTMTFGQNQLKSIGVGSLLYTPRPNYNNQFNLLEISAGVLDQAYNYKFSGDALCEVTGLTGDFVHTHVDFI